MSFTLLLLVSAMMGGCFAFPSITLFNNTGSALVLHSARNSYEIPAQGQRAIVDGTLVDRMSIAKNGTVWNYRFRYPPKSMRRGGLIRDSYLWQIEADGRIHVVGPLDHASTTRLSGQPEGFPLTPMDERAGR